MFSLLRKYLFAEGLNNEWYGQFDGRGYPHDGRADNAAYPHDGRADKRRYRPDRRADSQCYRYWLSARREYEIL